MTIESVHWKRCCWFTAALLLVCGALCASRSAEAKYWTDKEQLLELVRTWQAAKSSHPAMDGILARMPAEDKPSLVQDLIPRLHSENWQERANAIYVLGQLGPLARPAVPAMVAAMDIRMSNVATELSQALPRISTTDAVSALVAALPKTPAVSNSEWHIMECLAELGPNAASAAPDVVPYLDK